MRHTMLSPDTELIAVDDADEEVHRAQQPGQHSHAHVNSSVPGVSTLHSSGGRTGHGLCQHRAWFRQLLQGSPDNRLGTTSCESPRKAQRGAAQSDDRAFTRCHFAALPERRHRQCPVESKARPSFARAKLTQRSVFLAQLLLKEYHSSPEHVLFFRDRFSESNVLELGAGTGLLAIALGPLFAHYTATDLDFLVPLIRKNLTINNAPSSVYAEPLDWVALQSLPAAKRPPPDNASLVLAVDTLYNPALVPSFVAALEHYTSKGACALVVCELRAEDVIRDFLEAWLISGKWEIYRVGSELFELPFVGWVAWQSSQVQ